MKTYEQQLELSEWLSINYQAESGNIPEHLRLEILSITAFSILETQRIWIHRLKSSDFDFAIKDIFLNGQDNSFPHIFEHNIKCVEIYRSHNLGKTSYEFGDADLTCIGIN